MSTPEVAIIDFETKPIDSRPRYPPEPCGVAIKNPGEAKGAWYAWGFPTGNNCSKEKAQRALAYSWERYNILCQNTKFDYDVATQHMGMPALPWERMHDTMYLLFLHDPHAASLSLKPSAESILGILPSERDDLNDWILANVPEAKRNKKKLGKYIYLAPGDLVGRYALDGDVASTGALFEALYPSIVERGMLAAYDRKRHLMPIMLENEQWGVRVDFDSLERDYSVYTQAIDKVDVWLRKRLKTPGMNVASNEEFADALEASGVVTQFNYTAPSKRHPGGQRSVSKDNLTLDMFNDAQVASAYGYRNIISTCLQNQFGPWLAQAGESDGRLHTTWNLVRQPNESSKKTVGTRTGRFSCEKPNLGNVPKNWKKAESKGYVYPAFLGVPPLPLMRSYLLPDEGHVWCRRDFNQQELRLLAHFEDGPLMQMYQANPRLDIHNWVHDAVLSVMGKDMPRDRVKIVNFSDIYGKGDAGMADELDVTIQEVKELRALKDQLMPGVKDLRGKLKKIGKSGQPIRTWGGREYYCEEPKFIEKLGYVKTFEYKLLNYLVQPSGADATDEAIIRYHEHPKREGRFLFSVYDEINTSTAPELEKHEMAVLRECMQSIEIDVPLLSDGETGPTCGSLTKFIEPELNERTTIGDYQG